MPDSPFDLTVVDRLLSTTRSVRKRLDLDRPVELQTVLDCLDLAQQAPTGSNQQDWRFFVVTDPAKRAFIADTYRRVSAAYFASRAGSPDDGPQRARVRASSEYLRDNLQRIPVHVIPLIHRPVIDQPLAAVASTFGSIVPATWSFMLALRSRGLGSTYTTLHLVADGAEAVARELDIPDGWTQTALVPVAYSKGTDFKPASRPPVSEIVSVNTW